jgi:hypothetical protein
MQQETIQLEEFSARKRKQKPGPELVFPSEPDIATWSVVAIDPSLSRTGFARSTVSEAGAVWESVGSWKPKDSSQPVWARAAAIGYKIRLLCGTALSKYVPAEAKKLGLLLVMEAPPPRNDWLSSLQRVIFMTLGQNQMQHLPYGAVRILLVNASTLRSQMALTKTGSKNKTENVQRAYDFIERSKYPQLDTDSCDAVLLSVVGVAAAEILMGRPDAVADNFRTLLCDTTSVIKGKGKNARETMKGLLHNRDYFWRFRPLKVEIATKDAKLPTSRLEKQYVDI